MHFQVISRFRKRHDELNQVLPVRSITAMCSTSLRNSDIEITSDLNTGVTLLIPTNIRISLTNYYGVWFTRGWMSLTNHSFRICSCYFQSIWKDRREPAIPERLGLQAGSSTVVSPHSWVYLSILYLLDVNWSYCCHSMFYIFRKINCKHVTKENDNTSYCVYLCEWQITMMTTLELNFNQRFFYKNKTWIYK